MVHIVGAGPGALDLITVRGQRLLQEADVVIYAGSLVNCQLLELTKKGARLYDSAAMTLEEVTGEILRAEEEGLTTVRLHTGDPSIYGAIREQMDWMEAHQISYDICPGVSSFCGAAAALGMEYTLPGVSQSVIITRMGGRTPVPEKESIRKLAAHETSMAVFLSAGMMESLAMELVAGGYSLDTPAAIVYKATWPEEKIVRCSLKELAGKGRQAGISKTALIIVGNATAQSGYERSRLYAPDFTTEFRKASQVKKRGTLYVVGIGPGSMEQMTGEARRVLGSCQVIAGYKVYADLVRPYFPEKEYCVTAMTQEETRCRMAFECCMEGKDTAMICSGDSGIYGMAGLVLELSGEYGEVPVKVISGVTAASAGAALLGAPLMHDFAVISLSDRLTELDTIWDRVEKAAQSDFVLCLYNPSSKGRPDYLRMACERILKYRPQETVCGLARCIGRDGEQAEVLSLKELSERQVDMFTTVFIGNKSTRKLGGCMVTPRGYRHEG